MNVIKTYQNVFIASFFAQKVLALILDIIKICHNFSFPDEKDIIRMNINSDRK